MPVTEKSGLENEGEMDKPSGDSSSLAKKCAVGDMGQWTLMTPPVEFLDGITEREITLALRFTGIRSIENVYGEPMFSIWLVIENQQFQLAVEWETGEQAAWYCWQLAKALAKLERRR
jgi:hypothetical protein